MPVTILSHPLVNHKLTIIRDKNTKTKDFHEVVSEIASLMTYEITKDFTTKKVEIETPLCKTIQYELDKEVVLVPVLRAGLGMVEGIRRMIPTSKVGIIGLYRNEETLEPVEYYSKHPNSITDSIVIVLDPMLATGGSAVAAISMLKKKGANNIRFVGLVAAPEGVKALQEAHPDVDIYLAALDERLNDKGYIVPGLGDCGDRLFGTK